MIQEANQIKWPLGNLEEESNVKNPFTAFKSYVEQLSPQ